MHHVSLFCPTAVWQAPCHLTYRENAVQLRALSHWFLQPASVGPLDHEWGLTHLFQTWKVWQELGDSCILCPNNNSVQVPGLKSYFPINKSLKSNSLSGWFRLFSSANQVVSQSMLRFVLLCCERYIQLMELEKLDWKQVAILQVASGKRILRFSTRAVKHPLSDWDNCCFWTSAAMICFSWIWILNCELKLKILLAYVFSLQNFQTEDTRSPYLAERCEDLRWTGILSFLH